MNIEKYVREIAELIAAHSWFGNYDEYFKFTKLTEKEVEMIKERIENLIENDQLFQYLMLSQKDIDNK